MPYLNIGKENSHDVRLHYTDRGDGDPVVLIHGFPFSGMAWEKQEFALLNSGLRVITYDRRGFGLSSQPSTGYNYDTFADDLQKLLTHLDLTGVTLVGHSMGTGEVARYLGIFGSARIRRAVFIAPIPPFLLKTEENKIGADRSLFEGFQADIRKDRFAFLTGFFNNFYNTDRTLGKLVSEEKLRSDFIIASLASPVATHDCVFAWQTDFRRDLPKIDVPALVIQGDADRILPFEATGVLLSKEIEAPLVKIAGGSHGICWTHGDQVSLEILKFIEETETKRSPDRRASSSRPSTPRAS